MTPFSLAQAAVQFDQMQQLKVQDLMQPDQKTWNMEALQHYLTPQSVLYALNTPLFASVNDDERIWRPDNRGVYNVRSAYKFCLTELIDNAGLKVEGDWMSIWKLAVPPKVKKFTWQVARNCLPTRARLIEKGVQVGVNCPWCNEVPETATHVLMQCNKSNLTWRNLNLSHYIEQALQQHDNIGGMIFYLSKTLSKQEQCSFLMNLWSLWRSRNVFIWDHKNESTAEIIHIGSSLLSEWRNARRIEEQTSLIARTNRDSLKWKRPPHGFFKCNVDGSFSEYHNRVGIGMCLRDEFGMFVGAKIIWLHQIMSVVIGEASGLLAATEWVKELEFEKVIFCMDSKVVVDSLNSHV
ncbi:ribonuclease H, partial [Trifolium pratense]